MLIYRLVIAGTAAAAAAAAVAVAAVAAGAAAQHSDPTIDLLLQSMVISVEIPLPKWEDGPAEWGGKAPRLSFLKREARPALGDVYSKFFKNIKEMIGREPVAAPAYGQGTRYKGPRMALTKGGAERVGVSFYVDVYDWGFEYVNNLAEEPTNLLAAGATPENPRYDYKFTREEGIATAKKFLQQLTPGIGEPGAGCTVHEECWFEHAKGRLFVYRVSKSYRGVPVVDDYIQVAIDGAKNLANISYFWTHGFAKYGETYTAIDAGRALQSAKLIALDDFGNQPPPLTLFGVRLGYVNYRKNPEVLLPAWLFDLKWNEKRSYENPQWDARKAEQRFLSEVVTHEYLIGVDAFFGAKVELVPPGF